MRKMKLIGWVAGLSMVATAMTTAPARAVPANHAGTATNVSGNTAIQYGFEPTANFPTLNSSTEGTINAINSLTGGGQTGDAIDSLAGADISPETRAALLKLSERLNRIGRGLWAGDELDLSIRDAATELLRDLAEADTSCQANIDTAKCVKLSNLAKKITAFVSSVENLRTNLIKNGQEARIY